MSPFDVKCAHQPVGRGDVRHLIIARKREGSTGASAVCCRASRRDKIEANSLVKPSDQSAFNVTPVKPWVARLSSILDASANPTARSIPTAT